MLFFHSLTFLPQLNIRLYGTVPGDWVVVGLPYPSTTFTVTRPLPTTTLQPVNSLDQLDKYHYYYDSVNEYLYLRVEHDIYNDKGVEDLLDIAGYTARISTVSVTAGCGTTCTVSSSWNNPVLPPAIAIEDGTPTLTTALMISFSRCL